MFDKHVTDAFFQRTTQVTFQWQFPVLWQTERKLSQNSAQQLAINKSQLLIYTTTAGCNQQLNYSKITYLVTDNVTKTMEQSAHKKTNIKPNKKSNHSNFFTMQKNDTNFIMAEKLGTKYEQCFSGTWMEKSKKKTCITATNPLFLPDFTVSFKL